MRLEKDVVTSTENCYQKDAQLCGPRNCKVIEKLAISTTTTTTTNVKQRTTDIINKVHWS